MSTIYLVKNSNGAILGGYKTYVSALSCKRRWERRYQDSMLVGSMKVYIKKTKAIA